MRKTIQEGRQIDVENVDEGTTFTAEHQLSDRQVDVLLTGGIINWMKDRLDDDEQADIDIREPEPGRPEEISPESR